MITLLQLLHISALAKAEKPPYRNFNLVSLFDFFKISVFSCFHIVFDIFSCYAFLFTKY